MQLEFCHTVLFFRVIKTSPDLRATQLRKEASFGGGGEIGRRSLADGAWSTEPLRAVFGVA